MKDGGWFLVLLVKELGGAFWPYESSMRELVVEVWVMEILGNEKKILC